MTENGTRRKIDMGDLTFAELIELEELTDKPLSELMGGRREAPGMAMVAWMVARRDEPDLSFDALTHRLKMGDVEFTQAGEARAADTGGAPQSLPESGVSAQPT